MKIMTLVNNAHNAEPGLSVQLLKFLLDSPLGHNN